MKSKLLLIGLVLAIASIAQATVYTVDFNGINASVPDGNPGGFADTRSIALGLRPGEVIGDINVKLNISGGYNGDLYAYVVHNSGFAVLLNRVGTGSGPEPQFSFGYGDSGLNILLDDQAANSIHTYRTVGGYATAIADGSPWSSDGLTLGSFNGLDPNGSWTLFLADLSGGDQSTLVSWGLEISVIPEPATWALVIFITVATAIRFRSWLRTHRIQS